MYREGLITDFRVLALCLVVSSTTKYRKTRSSAEIPFEGHANHTIA